MARRRDANDENDVGEGNVMNRGRTAGTVFLPGNRPEPSRPIPPVQKVVGSTCPKCDSPLRQEYQGEGIYDLICLICSYRIVGIRVE